MSVGYALFTQPNHNLFIFRSAAPATVYMKPQIPRLFADDVVLLTGNTHHRNKIRYVYFKIINYFICYVVKCAIKYIDITVICILDVQIFWYHHIWTYLTYVHLISVYTYVFVVISWHIRAFRVFISISLEAVILWRSWMKYTLDIDQLTIRCCKNYGLRKHEELWS